MAGRICDHLVDRFGRENILRDVDSIPFGVDVRKFIAEKIAQSDLLLAIVGPNWLDLKNSKGLPRLEDPDDFVRFEIESALHYQLPIIPVLIDEMSMPTEDTLPAELKGFASHKPIVIRHDPFFHEDIGELIGEIKKRAEQPKHISY